MHPEVVGSKLTLATEFWASITSFAPLQQADESKIGSTGLQLISIIVGIVTGQFCATVCSNYKPDSIVNDEVTNPSRYSRSFCNPTPPLLLTLSAKPI